MIDFTTRARRPILNENLTPPFVAVADPLDGLIKTIDLATDIIVDFPVWEGAELGDHYSLYLNEVMVGQRVVLDPLPPEGSPLSLALPVKTQLLTDGPYKLQYLTISMPGGTGDASPAITLIVDRTPPGEHQLGYMDFPDIAKDGLTADELRDMEDVLTGSIFGYSGLRQGDVINTYWGSVAGPEIKITGDEDETRPITVDFSKSFLTGLQSPAGATYYTVTDRAGNISAESRKVTIPLFLTEVTPGLPAPIVVDGDNFIDYQDALAGVDVNIPASPFLKDGDLIILHWGAEKLGPVPINPDDLGEPVVLIFEVQFETIELAQNGLRQVKYEVLRDGQVVGLSDNRDIPVNIELPVPGTLDKPTVRGGSGTPSNEDNVIDENDFELNATVLINWNPGFKASQVIKIFWGEQEVLDQPYTITNSDVVAGRPLLLTALNTKFTPVGTGLDIRVYYTVTISGNPNPSRSLEQGIIVRSKDELPGGPDGPDGPEYTDLNENGAINPENGAAGAPVFIKPYINIAEGQVITFTYEAYDDLVGGNKKFEWSHTSPSLTQNEVLNGYNFLVPRSILNQHCYGHTESSFKVQSDKGQGNSKRTSVYVDMRFGGICNI